MKKIKESLCNYILFFVVLLFGMIMAVLYSVPVLTKGLVFSLYTLLGMLLPGYALTRALRIKCKTDVEVIAYTIFFGYLVSFIEYFFVVPFRIQRQAPLVWIIITLISIAYLLFDYKKSEWVSFAEKDSFGTMVCLALFLVVLLIKGGLYAGLNLLPYDEVSITGIYEDLLYWMGNTVELTKRFPPYSFFLYGVPFNYHYFTSVQLAGASLATGISPGLISLCFSYVYPSLMLVYGGYVVYSKCSKDNWLRLGAMIAFLFTSGFSDVTDNRYAGYMYEYPFAFDYGIAIFMFLTFLVMKEFYKEKLKFKNISIVGVFFILLCGVKANFGAIALVGMGMCCFRWFFDKNQKKKAILLGSVALGIFIFVYIFVTNLKGYSGSILGEFMVSNLLTNGSGYGDGKMALLYNNILSHGIPVIPSAIIIAIVYTLLSNPLVFVIMTYQVIRTLCHKEKMSDGSGCLLAMIAAGVFLCVFIGMYGWSERYFMYNTFPIGIAFVLLNWKTVYSKDLLSWIRYGSVLILFFVSIYGFIKYDGRIAFVQDIARGYSRYLGSDYYVEYKNIITKKQLEAYEWLSKTADRYDFALTNHSRTEWEINVFGEIFMFYEPSETYPISWGVYVKEEGGDFDKYFENELGLHVVFENEEVLIYGK